MVKSLVLSKLTSISLWSIPHLLSIHQRDLEEPDLRVGLEVVDLAADRVGGLEEGHRVAGAGVVMAAETAAEVGGAAAAGAGSCQWVICRAEAVRVDPIELHSSPGRIADKCLAVDGCRATCG